MTPRAGRVEWKTEQPGCLRAAVAPAAQDTGAQQHGCTPLHQVLRQAGGRARAACTHAAWAGPAPRGAAACRYGSATACRDGAVTAHALPHVYEPQAAPQRLTLPSVSVCSVLISSILVSCSIPAHGTE